MGATLPCQWLIVVMQVQTQQLHDALPPSPMQAALSKALPLVASCSCQAPCSSMPCCAVFTLPLCHSLFPAACSVPVENQSTAVGVVTAASYVGTALAFGLAPTIIEDLGWPVSCRVWERHCCGVPCKPAICASSQPCALLRVRAGVLVQSPVCGFACSR